MFGIGMMTPEMLERWAEGLRDIERRVEAYKQTGMPASEAYMRAYSDREREAWRAAEDRKLADIRENGT